MAINERISSSVIDSNADGGGQHDELPICIPDLSSSMGYMDSSIVLVGSDPRVVLLNFGLSYRVDAGGVSDGDIRHVTTNSYIIIGVDPTTKISRKIRDVFTLCGIRGM